MQRKRFSDFYQTLNEAMEATIALGITSWREYNIRYKEDSKLPSNPNHTYSKEMDSSTRTHDIFGNEIFKQYRNWEEARKATKKLKIKTFDEYRKRYKEDPRLPALPPVAYADVWKKNGSLYGFFYKKIPLFYMSWALASRASQALNIIASTDYAHRYKEDPRLPSAPQSTYSKHWKLNNGWDGFLGRHALNYYSSWSEASEAAIKLGIQSFKEYKQRFREDPLLPCCPDKVYKRDWKEKGGYRGFLNSDYVNTYSSWEEASLAVKKLGIKSDPQYKKRHTEDPRLPKSPKEKYQKVWKDNGGAYGFFGSRNPSNNYKTWLEASNAAKALGISNFKEYKSKYKLDIRLPSTPNQIYKNVWKKNGNYRGFVGAPNLRKKSDIYKTWEEANASVLKLGITSVTEYKKKYIEDNGLTSTPHKKYSKKWITNGGFTGLLLPQKYSTIDDVKHAVKVLGIKNSKSYRDKYKQYNLPAHPERTFKSEWIDWFDLCDIPKPYSYDDICALVRHQSIKSIADYRKFLSTSNDPRLPASPHEHYSLEWVNWHVFLDKEEPFKTSYIQPSYSAWGIAIKKFLKTAFGGSSKESSLCRFVRGYIEKNKLAKSPCEFLMESEISVARYREFIEQQKVDYIKPKIHLAAIEFLDEILNSELTEEDDETGELIIVSGAKNRLKNVMQEFNIKYSRPNETVRSALVFQYVDKLKNWIIPHDAISFSDLKHLHIYDADWVEVDPKIIDKEDLNCVFKEEDNKLKLWCPMYWMHTYALASVPARGRQLAYSDSGEADENIAQLQDNQLIWMKNTGDLAGQTTRQSFVREYPNGQFGMHFTTNKTSNSGTGYDVPWIPEKLAYWIVLLRNWQTKFNSLSKPTSWMNLQRTNLNESQRKAKGSNCLLFRDFGGVEPGYFTGRLSKRLAAALYHSQPKDLPLAELTGSKKLTSLSCYQSAYTPHSMRVSLITAYVMEFGLPLEIIMKVVGHSSIVMSIYYVKSRSEDFRSRFNEGEKIAFKNKAYTAQRYIEQNRIDSIKHELVANSKDALALLSNTIPSGNFLVRDYGICPNAGTKCDDGGELIASTTFRSSVICGYLGTQNCLRCRHFITGPAFLGGLISLTNEISLQANFQSKKYNALNDQCTSIKEQISIENERKYDTEKDNIIFDETERISLTVKLRKIEHEIESCAKKLDMFMSDMQSAYRLLQESKNIISGQAEEKNNGMNSLKLIASSEHDLEVIAEETSFFHQLCEVCENAEIFESASAGIAIAPRSQLLDKMFKSNGLQPHLYTLTLDEQLFVGNQLIKLLIARLKVWSRVDLLIEGRIRLDELYDSEHISPLELTELVSPKLLHKNGAVYEP